MSKTSILNGAPFAVDAACRGPVPRHLAQATRWSGTTPSTLAGQPARSPGEGRARGHDGPPWTLDCIITIVHSNIAVNLAAGGGRAPPSARRAGEARAVPRRRPWLYFAGEVHDAAEIDQGAAPRIRDQERTLAERLIGELSGAEFRPESYEDEYRKRLLKAIDQKVAGEEIRRIEVEARPPTTDLVATLKASLGRKELAKAGAARPEPESAPAKRPARRRRAP